MVGDPAVLPVKPQMASVKTNNITIQLVATTLRKTVRARFSSVARCLSRNPD